MKFYHRILEQTENGNWLEILCDSYQMETSLVDQELTDIGKISIQVLPLGINIQDIIEELITWQ
jgi:hypothetical protein